MDEKTRRAVREHVQDYRDRVTEKLIEIENRNCRKFEDRITIQDVAFLRSQHIKIVE